MKTVTIDVSLETIKNMKLELPVGNILPHDFLRCYIKAFIAYMTSNAIVSDDCLMSSIGKSYAQKAMIEGLKERIKDQNMLNKWLEYIGTDTAWNDEVILQRRGVRGFYIYKFGETLGNKLADAQKE